MSSLWAMTVLVRLTGLKVSAAALNSADLSWSAAAELLMWKNSFRTSLDDLPPIAFKWRWCSEQSVWSRRRWTVIRTDWTFRPNVHMPGFIRSYGSEWSRRSAEATMMQRLQLWVSERELICFYSFTKCWAWLHPPCWAAARSLWDHPTRLQGLKTLEVSRSFTHNLVII